MMGHEVTDNPESRARGAFARHFDADPALLVQAPGRVNLIGEHTDYNDGLVLPCAIDFGTVVAARRRTDGVVRVVAADLGDAADGFAVRATLEKDPAKPWTDYVRGAVQVLVDRGVAPGGADLAIAGDVPQGAGLSSSASLLVALISTFLALDEVASFTPTDIAVAARAVENEFVGVQCGIMDQLVSARGVANHALLIDCRTLDVRPVEVAGGLKVLIVHSGIERGLVGSEYNRRREECSRAARHYGVPALRDVDMAMLVRGREGLDDDAFRRARHIVSENARVVDTASALAAGDTDSLERLMAASHASMRDDFEITTPGIDRLVEILAGAVGDRGGVRMTGGGFGGCVVSVLAAGAVPAALAAVANLYRTPEGLQAATYLCQASQGSRVIARL
jgi:galactokinase